MLDFLIFAGTFVICLILGIIYVYPSSRKETTVPGLSPTTKEDGNLADISRAGSLHEFLIDLHKQFGAVASFWMGPKLVISISTPELFKQHQGVFDRPAELFGLFEPLFSGKCVHFVNGAEGRSRRAVYDKSFTHDELKKHYSKLQKVAEGLSTKWSSMVKEEHIPLGQYMLAYSIKAVLLSMLGDYFEDDKEVLALKTQFDLIWSEMEHRLVDPILPEKGSPRAKTFNAARESIYKILRSTIDSRNKRGKKPEDMLLIDQILGNTTDKETREQDCLRYLVGGFHTTGNLLTWAFYFLASHQAIQDKLHKELDKVLGADGNVDHQNSGDLKYLHQVIEETLRCAVVYPWAARFQDFDSELGGHKIPKNTPVIHALGVSLQDEKTWPLPNKFDPDRFTPEHSKDRQQFAFSPFGFAGKRQCPGQRFAYQEALVCLTTLMRKFKIELVEGQVVTPVYGLATRPTEEIWITVSKRK